MEATKGHTSREMIKKAKENKAMCSKYTITFKRTRAIRNMKDWIWLTNYLLEKAINHTKILNSNGGAPQNNIQF